MKEENFSHGQQEMRKVNTTQKLSQELIQQPVQKKDGEQELSNNHQMRGFIMIEVIAAMIILVGIISWFIVYQGKQASNAIATRVSNEYNLILDASISYYYNEQQKWPSSIDVLVSKHYLEPQKNGSTKILNPFAQSYTIKIITTSSSSSLQLSSNIPVDKAYVADKSIADLPFAKILTNVTGYLTVQVTLPEPPLAKPIRGVVRNVTVAHSGDLVEKPNCSDDPAWQPAIYTSAAQSIDANGVPDAGVNTYAKSVNTKQWQVFMKQLTETGWQVASPDTGKIEVITKCQNVGN